MIIINKRATLAALMRGCGALRLLELFATKPGLVVLVYHRVAEPRDDRFYTPLISATPESFAAQMRWLATRFEVVSLERVLMNIDDQGCFHASEAQALVTFDDGYRDNLTCAAPIMRDVAIPATLFVTTGFLDGDVPWWDRVAWTIKATRRDSIDLERPERMTLSTQPRQKTDALARVINAFIRAGWHATDDELAHLAERASVDLSEFHEEARRLFLGWDELRSLRASGWSIGAHTLTHRRLSALNEADQRRELAESRARIEAELGVRVETLAYPYGGPDAFGPITQRVARGVGYRAAFGLQPAVLHTGAIDPWAIPRFLVGRGDTLSMLRARLTLAGTVGRSFV